jgi:hypothetical protein
MIARQFSIIHAAIIAAFTFAFLQLTLLVLLIHSISVNTDILENVYHSNKLFIEEVQHFLNTNEFTQSAQ